jgi:hypothetical protein
MASRYFLRQCFFRLGQSFEHLGESVGIHFFHALSLFYENNQSSLSLPFVLQPPLKSLMQKLNHRTQVIDVTRVGFG